LNQNFVDVYVAKMLVIPHLSCRN